jgi:hypothetical protein
MSPARQRGQVRPRSQLLPRQLTSDASSPLNSLLIIILRRKSQNFGPSLDPIV